MLFHDEASLAWALAEAATPHLCAAERNAVHVAIGVGDTFAAIHCLITSAADNRISLPSALVHWCTRWLDAYAGHEDEWRLRGLVEHVLAPLTRVGERQPHPSGDRVPCVGYPADGYRPAIDRILVGVDGSPASTAAAVWAAGEAAMYNTELTIVHVPAASSDAATQMKSPAKPSRDNVTNVAVAHGAEAIDDALDAVTKDVDPQPPRITRKLRIGPVVPTLWEFTQEGARMIVLGRHSRGNSRRAALGSVTDEMLQTARCPVTVVPHEPVSQTQAGPAAVVVGINASPASQLAIAVAFDEAARRKTLLVAVHAVTPTHLWSTSGKNAVTREAEYVCTHALADWQLRYPNVDVRRVVTRDDPVQALLKHSRHAQLVVVGGGRSSVIAKPFDGVSSAVAQACRIPVIVARRKPSVCQPETIGDLRKTGRSRQFR